MRMMSEEEEVDLYVKARLHYGDEHQMRKCAEECCELATAIMRLTNGCDGHTEQQCLDNVIEEMVDVDIMLNQMWGIFGPRVSPSGLTFNDIKKKKLHRLQCRIEEEQSAEA